MKKMMWLCLLLMTAGAGFGQESRQDVSASASYIWQPSIYGHGVQLNTTKPIGFLGSYRFMLTPHSALEANYGYTQTIQKYSIPGTINIVDVHSRQQEVSVAYVQSFNFRNFNPFAEIGVGTMFFSPIQDYESTSFDTKRNTNIGGLAGIGVAYELSPSWDIRAEYRGFIIKAPDFKLNATPSLSTGRYMFLSSPSIGIAYHF